MNCKLLHRLHGWVVDFFDSDVREKIQELIVEHCTKLTTKLDKLTLNEEETIPHNTEYRSNENNSRNKNEEFNNNIFPHKQN